MKHWIQDLFWAAALSLASFGPPVNAKDPPSPLAQTPLNDSVRPPMLLPGMNPTNQPAQIIQMLQSGAAKNTILAQIKRSACNISAANVVYLNDLGAPPDIEAALMRKSDASDTSAQPLNPLPASQTNEPQDVTEDYFYSALAPYGTWINIPGYGPCWQPCAAAYNPGWAPYRTLGQWIYTDYGWYWLSGYSWGWCVFHYGRWFHDARRGWLWWPSTTWAPSWVYWRYWSNYCGWAPLPPHCYYSEETGLMYKGVSIPPNYDFGLDANLFDFVPMANLCDANIEHPSLSAAQSAQVFARSQSIADINSNDRIIANDGIPVSWIAKFQRGAMRSVTIRPEKTVPAPGARGEMILGDGETLAINRPYFSAEVPSALKQGLWPNTAQGQPVPHQPPTFIVNQIPYSYPAAGDQDNSVIYVDTASQNGHPVPTVTMAGPADYAASAPATAGPAQSYWAPVLEESSAPIDTASAYLSPRLRSQERWRRKVRQPADHREFNPGAAGPPSRAHDGNHGDRPGSRTVNPHQSSSASTGSSSRSQSPAPRPAPGPASSIQNHGR